MIQDETLDKKFVKVREYVVETVRFYNPDVATTFFRASLIEAWDRHWPFG